MTRTFQYRQELGRFYRRQAEGGDEKELGDILEGLHRLWEQMSAAERKGIWSR